MSLTKISFALIKNAYVNVQNFGATGDGSTDDTDAIQNAINYAESTATPPSAAPGIVSVYFPFGLYIISDALVVTKSISFVGEGHSEYSTGARIIQNTASKDHFTVQPIAQGCSVSWSNITMTANGNGGTSGSCINITKTTAACNSVRIIGCTFGTPQTFAIKIQSSDDVIIENNLFDVSAVNCISLGTVAANDVVSNCSITNNAFFQIGQKAFLLYNVIGLIISNNRVYKNTGSPSMLVFIDGTNTLPYQITDLIVTGNKIAYVNVFALLTNAQNTTIANNTGTNIGTGSGATQSCIELSGVNCSNIVITGNALSGSFDTKNFYNDSSATVTKSVISANSFVNTAGAGAALYVSNTTGTITENAMTGFVTNSVGQHFFTTGSAISPGVINAGASYTYTLTLTGVKQGDQVQLSTPSTAWPVPVGIVVNAYSSGVDAVSLRYDNPTASPIGVPAHDFGILVTR